MNRKLTARLPERHASSGPPWDRWFAVAIVACTFILASSTLVRLGTGINFILWLGLYGLFAVKLLSELENLPRILRLCLPFLVWAVLAAVSVLWSLDPARSLYTSIQLLFTILVSAYIGYRFELGTLVVAIAVLLLALCAGSLVVILLQVPVAFNESGKALGLFDHKNVLGARSCLLFACGLALLARPGRRALGLACALVAVAVVLASESATSQVVVLIILAAYGLTLLYLSQALLFQLAALTAFSVLAAVVLIVDYYGFDLWAFALQLLGKDVTLTGRTVLWELSWSYVMQHPLLGYGYDSFWSLQASPVSPQALVQRVVKDDIHSFHNSFIEIAIDLGLLGVIAFVATLLIYAGRVVQQLFADRDREAIFPFLLLVYIAVLIFVEHEVFRQHAMLQIMFGIAFASTLKRTRGRRRRASRQALPDAPIVRFQGAARSLQ